MEDGETSSHYIYLYLCLNQDPSNFFCISSWIVRGTSKAPGEAEAELAYLNQIGVIDAVWTDDVDTLVFGATLVIRK